MPGSGSESTELPVEVAGNIHENPNLLRPGRQAADRVSAGSAVAANIGRVMDAAKAHGIPVVAVQNILPDLEP